MFSKYPLTRCLRFDLNQNCDVIKFVDEIWFNNIQTQMIETLNYNSGSKTLKNFLK